MAGEPTARKPRKKPLPKAASGSSATPPKRRRRAAPALFPIVGIGASAGGLEAVTALLHHMPPATHMAFVLVQHLDPTHESALTALLSRATAMPVLEARDRVRLEPDHVYVIPPNKLMEISKRRLRLSPRQISRATYTPIDHFLCSLAAEEGNRAIGIILSGTGSDGTQGLRAVKAAGGIAFAQDERTAKYPAMPASAVAAGCVDFVMTPEKIAAELARIAGHPYIAPPAEEPEMSLPTENAPYAEILTILRQRMGVDFALYKPATLRRRIQRRMVLQKAESLNEYAAYLGSHAAEVKDLFQDVLIHVTGFVRDARVFNALRRKVFPRLIKDRAPEDAIRIWAPGCSTGEEVYSLAMVLAEFLQGRKAHFPVQVFGTDIDEAALDKARAAFYPESIGADVSAERLRRFFTKVEGGYRINKAIREMCVFARQNVAADPPFSNLDLVSCRNVLIYLGPLLQRKVLPLFHYALRRTGFLVLGTSETIGAFSDLFSLVDKKTKIYARKTTSLRPPVSFGQLSALPKAARPAEPAAPAAPSLADLQKQADRVVLSHAAPAGVVVNRQLEVLQFRGRTGPYLEHAQGEANLSLLKMAREGLGGGLRSALSRAIKQNIPVREEGIRLGQDRLTREAHIEVIPFQVPPARERYYLVLFEPAAEEEGEPGAERKARARGADESAETGRLREELAATRESLQAIIEEQEATNEELHSANEEILSSNEELQSTNEELETAKEELQSTNEELTTVNDELESRNDDLGQANNDLFNLLGAVNIPIVMVGADQRIRRFTATAERILSFIPTDVGRPLTDINLRIEVPELGRLVAEVIDSLQTREVEARDKDGHWWSVRIRPYRTADNRIDGAVIALLDVDVLKTGAERTRREGLLTEAIVNTVREPLVVLDAGLRVQAANPAFYATFQVAPDDTLGHRIYELGDGQWDIPELRILLEEILPKHVAFQDFEIVRDFPRLGRQRLLLNARRLIHADGQTELILLAISPPAPASEKAEGQGKKKKNPNVEIQNPK